MACWVVPSLAAEFWGIPVAQVLERIRTGEIATKTELGFTLVDVAPSSPQVTTGRRPKEFRPPTCVMTSPSTILTEAEKRALAGDMQAEPVAVAAASSDEDRLDWRPTRQAVSRQRRAPRWAA